MIIPRSLRQTVAEFLANASMGFKDDEQRKAFFARVSARRRVIQQNSGDAAPQPATPAAPAPTTPSAIPVPSVPVPVAPRQPVLPPVLFPVSSTTSGGGSMMYYPAPAPRIPYGNDGRVVTALPMPRNNQVVTTQPVMPDYLRYAPGSQNGTVHPDHNTKEYKAWFAERAAWERANYPITGGPAPITGPISSAPPKSVPKSSPKATPAPAPGRGNSIPQPVQLDPYARRPLNMPAVRTPNWYVPKK